MTHRSLPPRAARRAAASLILSACAGAGFEPPPGPPYVRGPVASVTEVGGVTRLFVRAGPGSREACGIVATATTRTRLSRRSSAGALVGRATLRDVAVGDTVEVYPGPYIAESCPVQGEAVALVLLPRTAR